MKCMDEVYELVQKLINKTDGLLGVLEKLSVQYAERYTSSDETYQEIEHEIFETVVGYFYNWDELNRLQAENEESLKRLCRVRLRGTKHMTE